MSKRWRITLGWVVAGAALCAIGIAIHDGSGHSTIPGNDILEAVYNFSLFVFLLVALGRKPVMEFLTRRSESIAEGLNEAQRLHKEAEAKLADYEKRLASFEEERKQILEGYRREGEKERDEIIAAAKEHADRLRRDAALVIDYEIKRARRELKERVVNDAVGLARKTIRDKLDTKAGRRLVNDFTDALGEIEERPRG